MKKERIFKYYPEDFGDLWVKVEHMDLHFDVYEDYTEVESNLHLRALKNLDSIELNAKKLEIISLDCKENKCRYEYLQKMDILRIKFGKKFKKGQEFVIRTKSRCIPTKHILEGLYYDETPKGCPCQQITQCQQWGFQRIVPCIDDMTAKCTYTTRIVADKRYTNMISNGDISEEKHKFKGGRDIIKYDNMLTPMATYLFFLGVGTYATFKKEFEYPDGDKFMLELLVPPKSDKKIAGKALDLLHDAIMWVYLFTGPDKYQNNAKSLKIKKLVEERESFKASGDGQGLKKVRAQLAGKCKNMTFGYKYTGSVYREIAMQNSDFGGMENVGNTTITTNRIMPFPEMTDGSFEYMVRVKVHEFYHNLNGSEVTGRSPFEIWLNEAVTVFIEQEYHEFLFGKEYCRLDVIQDFLAPGSGTFASDDNVASMPIEPDGFNSPNELITGVTYVKAPEFVRMIETLMGKENFARGLHLYHSKYKHSNASRAQWVEAMETVSEMKFERMAQVWLKQSSYPKLHVKSEYDQGKRKLVLKLEQSGFKEGMHWEFPFVVGIVDDKGKDIIEKIHRVEKVEEKIVFENVPRPAFISLNRGYSFFGKVFYQCPDEELYRQARKDSDIVARYMAFYQIAEKQLIKLLEDSNAVVGKVFVDLYFELLSNKRLMDNVGPNIVTIFETVEDERFAHSYEELYQARKKIKKAVAVKYEGMILKMYREYGALQFEGSYIEVQSNMIKARQVKNTCLGLLAELEDKEINKLIKRQFESAKCATDKNIAFALYINSKAKDKLKVLSEYMKEAQKNLVSWESFLAIVARNNSEDHLDIIRKVEKSSVFRIEQANEQRALYCAFAGNRKNSLLKPAGREFLKEKILQLSEVNEYTTSFLLRTFGDIDKIAQKSQTELVKVLMEVKSKLKKDKTPSVYNTIERILKSSPKAMTNYNKIT